MKLLRIPLRELRSSPGKFLFVILAVAVGVGALTGVQGFSNSFRSVLLKEARTLMAADLLIRMFEEASEEQEAVLKSLQQRGVELTRITETVSMMSSDEVSTPVLVAVKAVDPKVYPFYGTVKLDPPRSLAETLTADTVGVSDDLVLRLKAGIGDKVRLGRAEYRIAAVVRLEPDRMTGSINVGPRIMMTREGLERADLMQVGSRASRRFLFRLPREGIRINEAREELEKAFPHTLITDSREVHPRIRSGLDRATSFLSLVSLIALIVGALGVAMAMYAHLQQRMDTIAVMKCLGAKSQQIIRIYLTQTLMLGVTGGLLGVALGSAVQTVFPVLIERYFQLRPESTFDISSSIQGLLVGILATLLFTLPPLLGIRDVRPAVIFRRDMMEHRKTWRERWLRMRASTITGGVILLGIGLLSAWLANDDLDDSIETSLFFLGGLVVSLSSLTAVAWGLLRLLKYLLHRAPRSLPTPLRHGVANLYRPGNHAEAVLVALGVGVMFTFTVFLLQNGLLQEMLRSAPRDMPNVFLVNITNRERIGLLELLKNQPGIQSEPGVFASVRAKIVTVDGTPVEELPLEGWQRRYRRERSVTWHDEMPPQTIVEQGAWWDPSSNAAETGVQLCLSEHIAEALDVQPGSVIDWEASGLSFRSSVACIHRVEEVRFGASLDFVFNPGSLDQLPTTYFGGVRVEPDAVGALQQATYEKYPTITVINAAEVLAIVQEVIDQVALVVRFVSLFAILAGVVILASSVAGTRFRRIREAAILKTLGATRSRVIAIFSLEFLILGGVAGLIGTLLATGFAGMLLNRRLDAPLQFDLVPAVVSVAITAVVAVAAGWLASYRILGQKPLEVLRHE